MGQRRAVIGVDVGTLSTRAGVFDLSGELLASSKRPIAIWHEPGDVVEHSSENIWAAVTAAVKEAVENAALPPDAYLGIGFDATCSLVVLDACAAPLSVSPNGAADHDVIVWMDHRAAGEAERINAGGHSVLRYVGGKISPEMQVPKIAWLAVHKPDVFARAGHFFDLTDYLTFRASGALERSLCTTTCKFTYLAHERRWDGAFFDAIGLGALKADGFVRVGARMVAPGTPLGRGLTTAAAEAMGLRSGLPVGAGLIDAHAGAVGTMGAGVGGARADPRRRMALILGTSSCCMALSDEPRFVDGVWGPYFSALTPGQWLNEGGQSAFGAAIDHLLRLHPAWDAFSRRHGAHALDALERDAVVRAGDVSRAALVGAELHVLPDFLGNRSPHADPRARGGVLGLDLRTDEASLTSLYVAGLTALAHGLAEIVRALEGKGHAFEMIVVSGGAAKSALVRRLIADTTGKSVGATRTMEPVLLGSAMLGAIAAGAYDMAGAMSAMSEIAETTTPSTGEAAAFHMRKRRAFMCLQTAERELRAIMNA